MNFECRQTFLGFRTVDFHRSMCAIAVRSWILVHRIHRCRRRLVEFVAQARSAMDLSLVQDEELAAMRCAVAAVPAFRDGSWNYRADSYWIWAICEQNAQKIKMSKFTRLLTDGVVHKLHFERRKIHLSPCARHFFFSQIVFLAFETTNEIFTHLKWTECDYFERNSQFYFSLTIKMKMTTEK